MGFEAQIINTDIVTQVYDQLRKAIFSNSVFKVGEKINIDKLSLDWKISKTPIREALKALEKENVVKHIPRKGFFVSVLEVDEMRDLSDLREALEIHALRKGFETIDRKRMKKFVSDFRKAMKLWLRRVQLSPIWRLMTNFIFILSSLQTTKKWRLCMKQ